MTVATVNRQINWPQWAAIVIPLLASLLTVARIMEKRVVILEERTAHHEKLGEHPRAYVRISDLETRITKDEAALIYLQESVNELKASQKEILGILKRGR